MGPNVRRRHPHHRRPPPERRAGAGHPPPALALTTLTVDLDGLDDAVFWKDYWDNGLNGTALYFLPHLDAMPERSVAVLSALVSAPEGGVLFHCMGGRDRTGLIALLLLAAIDTDPEAIVEDYLETVRLADLRAATSNRNNAEPEIEALCQTYGTTTEGAFRSALLGLDLATLLASPALSDANRAAITSWRGNAPRLSLMGANEFSIRSTGDSDWREVRDLRLEMIRDTPTGYAETLEEALRHDEAEWRMRGRRGASDQGIAIAAITESGRWVGTMAGFVPDPATGPLLVGVYVAPDFRGTKVGLTDALLTAIEDWARTESDQLTLHVHEDNVRARKAYENRGFVTTGQSVPYNLDPSRDELEMVKEL